jgi:hypothetical protein
VSAGIAKENLLQMAFGVQQDPLDRPEFASTAEDDRLGIIFGAS